MRVSNFNSGMVRENKNLTFKGVSASFIFEHITPDSAEILTEVSKQQRKCLETYYKDLSMRIGKFIIEASKLIDSDESLAGIRMKKSLKDLKNYARRTLSAISADLGISVRSEATGYKYAGNRTVNAGRFRGSAGKVEFQFEKNGERFSTIIGEDTHLTGSREHKLNVFDASYPVAPKGEDGKAVFKSSLLSDRLIEHPETRWIAQEKIETLTRSNSLEQLTAIKAEQSVFDGSARMWTDRGIVMDEVDPFGLDKTVGGFRALSKLDQQFQEYPLLGIIEEKERQIPVDVKQLQKKSFNP